MMHCTYGNHALADIAEHAECISSTKAVLVDVPPAPPSKTRRNALVHEAKVYLLRHDYAKKTVALVPGESVLAAILATPGSVATELLNGAGLLTAYIDVELPSPSTTPTPLGDDAVSGTVGAGSNDDVGEAGSGNGSIGADGGAGTTAAAERQPLVGAIAGASIALLLIGAGLVYLTVKHRTSNSSLKLIAAAHKNSGLKLSPGRNGIGGPTAAMISPYQYQPPDAALSEEYLALGSRATQRARQESQPMYAAPSAVLAGYTAQQDGGGAGNDDDDYLTIANQAAGKAPKPTKYMDPAPTDDWQAVQAILLQDHGAGLAVAGKESGHAQLPPQPHREPQQQHQHQDALADQDVQSELAAFQAYGSSYGVAAINRSGANSRQGTTSAEDEWNFMPSAAIAIAEGAATGPPLAGDDRSFRSGRTGSVVSAGEVEVLAAARKASAAARASEAALAGAAVGTAESPLHGAGASWISQLQAASQQKSAVGNGSSSSSGGIGGGIGGGMGGGAFEQPAAAHFYPANAF